MNLNVILAFIVVVMIVTIATKQDGVVVTL
jgi:hypothetical protein